MREVLQAARETVSDCVPAGCQFHAECCRQRLGGGWAFRVPKGGETRIAGDDTGPDDANHHGPGIRNRD